MFGISKFRFMFLKMSEARWPYLAHSNAEHEKGQMASLSYYTPKPQFVSIENAFWCAQIAQPTGEVCKSYSRTERGRPRRRPRPRISTAIRKMQADRSPPGRPRSVRPATSYRVAGEGVEAKH